MKTTPFSQFFKKNYRLFLWFLVVLPILLRLNYMVFYVYSDKTNQIKKGEDLVLGMHTVFPPFAFNGHPDSEDSFPTQDGEYASGFDSLLANKIAEKIGKKLIIKHYGYPAILDSIPNESTDIIMGGMNATKERLKTMEAVEYYSPAVGVLIRKDDPRFKDLKGDTVSKKDFQNIALKAARDNNPIKYSTITHSTFDLPNETTRTLQEWRLLGGGLARENSTESSFLVKNKSADICLFDYPPIKLLSDNDQSFKAFKLEGFTIPPVALFLKKDRNDGLKEKLIQAVQEINEKEKEDLLNKAFQDFVHIQSLRQQPQNTFVKMFKQLPFYRKAFIISVTLALNGLFLGFFLSLLVLLMKLFASHQKNSPKGVIYVKKALLMFIDGIDNALKAVPMIIQVLIVSKILTHQFDFFQKEQFLATFYTALLLLTINTAFNLAAIMFRNIRFLDQGQIEGAYALGMNNKQVFQHIIFEQTFQRTYPFIWDQLIINFKDTAVFGLIGVANLVYQANKEIAITFDGITPLLLISLIYLFLVNVVYILNRKHHPKKA
ncbi:transporter substrate-binding domain-containing protein [Candidatus Phytoplasma pruni]|uniref:Transporter substrate-binding domain-containing protein n=1 Tax=Candidatus Phytoplasma pruni TaxID=479893 RepID=A0A851H9M7_9MOLU|nr:transporter substrate-binding domain-containing protein [Candidatus Phytoplasma pruni]NWN45577.1 transporter substrate-binding domain-containing protein [Candidatus Phytoplasma pruni]